MSLAARMRHRVQIQERIETQDSETGDVESVWAVLQLDSSSSSEMTSVPAEVLTGPGREFQSAGTKQAETTARITLRWFPGLLETHRIFWEAGGKTYDIQSIETDITGRREYRLRCTDGVSNGG